MDNNLKDRPSLLIIDDDPTFCGVLKEALDHRGFEVSIANSVKSGIEVASHDPPEYAVVDLHLPNESGLEMVSELKRLDENTRIVVLTGYASIATAVEAIKLGAIHYLAKPADADEITAAFHRDEGDINVPVNKIPLSIARLEWEHIQKVLTKCDGNISETARKLNMHRRTLQRKLAKHPVKR
jgi:two-component system response regulator RegA